MVIDMKKLKKLLPEKYLQIIWGALLGAVGLFVLIFPDTSLITLCTVLGLGALGLGIVRIARYISDKKEQKQATVDVISGASLLVAALVLLLHPKFLLSVLPFFMGISILIYGISSFFSPRRLNLFSKIISVAVIIWGVSLMLNPFKGATTITAMVGFGLLALGVIKIVSEILRKKSTPALPDDIDGDGYIEVEFKDLD